MLSFAEILRRLITYFQKRFPGAAIGPQTRHSRLFLRESPSAWPRLTSEINKVAKIFRFAATPNHP
jgi:hypothetical protein